jgi:parallel beta-helix repeat protein
MAKRDINIGSGPNTKDGDTVRNAFDKVNQNFTELYSAIGLDDGSLNIDSLQFSGSTISTTDSSNVTITGNLVVDGTITGIVIDGGDAASG